MPSSDTSCDKMTENEIGALRKDLYQMAVLALESYLEKKKENFNQ